MPNLVCSSNFVLLELFQQTDSQYLGKVVSSGCTINVASKGNLNTLKTLNLNNVPKNESGEIDLKQDFFGKETKDVCTELDSAGPSGFYFERWFNRREVCPFSGTWIGSGSILTCDCCFVAGDESDALFRCEI